VIYYLDREGYLLDKTGHYLLDQGAQQIQLEQKHLNILKFYSLLQQWFVGMCFIYSTTMNVIVC
jgi:hypothetical protein